MRADFSSPFSAFDLRDFARLVALQLLLHDQQVADADRLQIAVGEGNERQQPTQVQLSP